MLDNELIRQKNHILDLVNDEKYEEALVLLNFIAPLWEDNTYSYKLREIKDRIKLSAQRHIADSKHWKTAERYKKLLAI